MPQFLPPAEATVRLAERARRYEDEVEPWRRGIIATQVWKNHPEWPIVARRAEVIARSLEEIEPIVLPEDAIIGVAYRRLRVHAGVGDIDAWRVWAKSPDLRGYREAMPIPPEVAAEFEWWRDNPPPREFQKNAPRRANPWLHRLGVASPHGQMGGHTLPDHAILLQAGVGDLRARIARRLSRNATQEQRTQLQAMDRILEALTAHAHLCAAAARKKAARIPDAETRRALEAAAMRCVAVATAPPATFPQALQLLFFSNYADILDNPGDAPSFGRIDQILFPFYQADIAAGRITPHDAFELVCRFLIKKWYCQSSNNMTLGGVRPDGADATNELSTMFLEAMEATRMAADLSVRMHPAAPPDFIRTVARVIRCGFGRPDIYNDEVTIEALTRKGVALEDARDYAPLGCVEVMIPGRTPYRTMCMGLNLPKVLELVLHQGACAVTGEQVWNDVPADFADFDDLLAEYRRRVRQIVDLAVEIIREDERLEPLVAPRPWLTVLSREGIEDARDITDGQPKYDCVGVTLDGLADAANSLQALRRIVYDERRLSLHELRRILRKNWQDAEPLRRYVINELPRFGQDAPDANRIAAQEARHFAACFEPHRTFYGGRFWPMIFGVSSSLVHGRAAITAATPSGRRTGDGLAMSLQPAASGPQGGITALIRACAAIDFRDFAGGVSNVQDCDPAHVAGEDGLERLVQILQTFIDLGGMEIALNFLDEEKLKQARQHPEEYQGLMVRLFGLSAQYVCLDDAMQNHVIERVRAAASRTA